MPTVHKRSDFFETFEGAEIEDMLRSMEADVRFNTEASYTPDAAKYPGHVMSFIEKHKRYILANPALDARAYVSNLRLKTRLR